MSDVRGWGDQPPSLEYFKANQLPALRTKYQKQAKARQKPQSNILALSGGGENGAFGAGLLVGWGERGDRPEFDMVTGVSAGALIAPFALLGHKYDGKLRELFTKWESKDIYETNIVGGVLRGTAVASNEPLKRLIAAYVDHDMMADIAR